MKKLIIGLAAVALAGSLQAATAAWGMKNDGNKTYANATVYMVLSADYTDVIAALNAGGSDIATTMAGFNTGDSVITLSGKGVGAGAKSDASSADGSYYWVVVMSGGAAIADGMQYYSTGAISYETMDAAGAIASGSATPSNFLLVDGTTVNLLTGTSGTIGAVPEPTSGLLLLLGVAGLALKRKRA